MEPIEQQDEETSDVLTISAKKAFFIIVKAREFDEKVAPSDPDSGSNPSDDKEVDVLEAGNSRSPAPSPPTEQAHQTEAGCVEWESGWEWNLAQNRCAD